MVTPTDHVIACAGFTSRGALGTLVIFANLSDKYRTPKKSHLLRAGHRAGTVPYYGKSSPSCHITFIKSLDEGVR